ncbi:hypothetical protein HPB51_016816 [Rhipicephalus microplus]|uniref:Uncharacterized protein n=1 Tax=Rhipicephalus microplus TaxID=6941 RepID=A0A9J6DIJ5_RHIMP|nr:hypothetical protein HPB51_016816 [Rhipicephalus microplus]
MDVTTCEDIPFLVRRVVREELVRHQAGDVHHQCSFAACPEPPPYWRRGHHVENRPRTETADFTPRLPFSPTGRGHHPMSSYRRTAVDLRPSPTRPLPEDYYASSQNIPAEHDPSPRTSAACAPANREDPPPCFSGRIDVTPRDAGHHASHHQTPSPLPLQVSVFGISQLTALEQTAALRTALHQPSANLHLWPQAPLPFLGGCMQPVSALDLYL